MEFEKFVETVKETIKDYLPDEYKNASVDVYPHEKLNESYLGMTVRTEGQVASPTLNLNMFYEQLQDVQMDMEDIMERMAEVVQITPMAIDMGILTDYEKAKENLFIRVSDADRNQEMLSKVPHTRVKNLAITYHIFANSGADGIASAIVNNEMMRLFGISRDQLHQDALENSPKVFPVKVESMDKMMENMMRNDMRAAGVKEEDIDQMMEEMYQNMAVPLTIVTNEQMLDGAAVLFYPGQMDQIGEALKGDYYILPSSTHEMLVLPDNGEMTSHELKRMVMEVNNSEVRPEEKLADEVYHYDSKDRIFEKASAFEERQKAKGKEQTMPGKKNANMSQPVHKPKQRANDMSL